MVTRSTWDEKFSEFDEKFSLTEGIKALIIVDDNKDCTDDTLTNCFRPSFPLPKV